MVEKVVEKKIKAPVESAAQVSVVKSKSITPVGDE